MQTGPLPPRTSLVSPNCLCVSQFEGHFPLGEEEAGEEASSAPLRPASAPRLLRQHVLPPQPSGGQEDSGGPQETKVSPGAQPIRRLCSSSDFYLSFFFFLPESAARGTESSKKPRSTGAKDAWTSLRSLGSRAKAPTGRCTKPRTRTLVGGDGTSRPAVRWEGSCNGSGWFLSR